MIKYLAKSLLRMTPYRVVRVQSANRFSAIEECLQSLGDRGYRPLRIIDGGANVGDFARAVSKIFPGAHVDLVEPQPACEPALLALANDKRFTIHAVALGSQAGSLRLAIDSNAVTTGAHVVLESDNNFSNPVVDVPVATIDSLFASSIELSDRALLKLDLQGWEMEALQGAESILQRAEVVLTEVSFFRQAYEPEIEALIAYLNERGFSLHDIASISGRRRDNRAHQGDFVFVRRGSDLMADTSWS